jgi:UDP-N-acetylmuramate dehydrogenase
LENSLTGLEFCYGIPGTVGGAVFMNAGAYGGEISEHFIRGRFLNGKNEIVTLNSDELEFGYRKSRLMREELILISAEFKAANGEKDEIRAKMDELMQKRKSKQPLDFPSCGSAFKRPEGYFAGALIEQCGLKGYSIGGARVSEKHAGFIINGGNATATDVIKLLEYVAETVFKNTGVMLEPEIRVIL